MGLGRFGGGIDTALWAAKNAKKVIATDLSGQEKLAWAVEKLGSLPNVELRLGEHITEDFRSADVVIVNPAVPPDNKFLQIARQSGAIITSQMRLFFKLCPAVKIGVTGANGKSTTTALTAHLLRAGAGKPDTNYANVWLGGNLGNQPLLEIVERIAPDDLVVLEISSFQAEQLAEDKTAPNVMLITNLAPNHLDRHGTFENYCAAKENLFRYQPAGAISIFNEEDEITQSWYEKYCKDKNRKCLLYHPRQVLQDYVELFKLPGRANLSNLAGALQIAGQFSVPADALRQAVGSFVSLPHRLEFVAEKHGVKYYNDSIATTPESTIVALEAFDCPIILIAGGYDKKLPFAELGKKISGRAKAVILIGATAQKIAAEVCPPAGKYFANTLENAILKAQSLAQKGDVVVMSPACASYDMFENFEHRGAVFREFVKNM